MRKDNKKAKDKRQKTKVFLNNNSLTYTKVCFRFHIPRQRHNETSIETELKTVESLIVKNDISEIEVYHRLFCRLPIESKSRTAAYGIPDLVIESVTRPLTSAFL